MRESLPGGAETKPGSVQRFANAVIAQRVAAMLTLDDGDLAAAKRWLDAHDRWLAWSGAVLGRDRANLFDVADRVLVLGDHVRNLLIKQGVAPARLVVLGDPRSDEVPSTKGALGV